MTRDNALDKTITEDPNNTSTGGCSDKKAICQRSRIPRDVKSGRKLLSASRVADVRKVLRDVFPNWKRKKETEIRYNPRITSHNIRNVMPRCQAINDFPHNPKRLGLEELRQIGTNYDQEIFHIRYKIRQQAKLFLRQKR